jgi:hypothetical protein
MTTEYRSDRGIEAAPEHLAVWHSVYRFGTVSAIGIVGLLVILFFALL